MCARVKLIPVLILTITSLQFSWLAQASSALQSAQFLPAQEQSPRYLADIRVNTSAELNNLLLRAEQLMSEKKFNVGQDEPVAFILHGPEARALLSQNYQQNKMLVDLAARLSAFKVVDIQVCETWMGGQGLDRSQLLPFVRTVSFGPGEEKRLVEKEGYIYF